MAYRQQLERRLEQLKKLIEEAEDRLGAHSVKPVLMQQLFELEEEREDLLAQLKRFSDPSSEDPS